MTRSDRTFPVGPRLLALGAAIVAILVSVPMAGASTPSPSKSQVQSAHQAYLDAQARISQYRSEIESVQAQLTVAVEKLDKLQAELAQIQAQVAETKQRLARAQARYERIRAQLGKRAAQAFIAGPASDLEDASKGFGAHSDQERILEAEIYRFVRFSFEIVYDLARRN